MSFGDRTSSVENNHATFVMSNMLPQEGDLNRHVWEGLESYCRDRVKLGNEMYIVADGYGSKEQIADGKVNVPAACWKVIIELPEGNNDLARINANTHIIAVDMPNEEGIAKHRWQQYITTVLALEKATRYNLLSNVPLAIQRVLEARRDSGWAATDRASSGRASSNRNTTQSTGNQRSPSPRTPAPRAGGAGRVGGNHQAPELNATQGQTQVWVNTKSGVYHYQHQQYYGKTKQGEFMTEAEAVRRGYRANQGP